MSSLEVDPHAVLHVELARVELMLVIAGRLGVLKVLPYLRQVLVGEARRSRKRSAAGSPANSIPGLPSASV